MATSITNTSISTDTINVDSGVLYVDNNNNRVGIGTTTPNTSLHISAGSSVGSLTNAFEITDSGYTNIQMLSGGADGEIKIGAAGQLRGSYKAQYAGTGGAHNFNIGTNSTNAITIDTNQYIGIGTTSPSGGLTLYGNGYGNKGKLFVYGGGDENNFSQNRHEAIRIGRGDIKDSYYNSIWSATGSGGESQHWLRFYINQGQTSGTAQILAMEMNGNGHVLTPNQPGFLARGVGSWSDPGNADLVFTDLSSSSTYNDGNHYSTSNGRFTAPVAGKYILGANIYHRNDSGYDDDTNHQYWYFYRNGSPLTNTNNVIMHYQNSGDADSTHPMSIVVKLNAGDYITVRNSNASGSGSYYMGGCEFWGTLLG